MSSTGQFMLPSVNDYTSHHCQTCYQTTKSSAVTATE